MTLPNLTKHLSFGTISLRWMLVVPFVVPIVAAVGLVGYLSYRSGLTAVDDLAHQIVDQASERVCDRLGTTLKNAQQVLTVNHLAVAQGRLDIKDFDRLQDHLWQQIQLSPALTAVYYANESGEGIAYSRLLSQEIVEHAKKATGENLEIGTLLLDEIKPAHPNQRKYYLVDERGRAKKLIYTLAIDNRTTTWYLAGRVAKKPIWSPIFVYRFIPSLGISAVISVNDETGKLDGVLAIPVALSDIGTFLSKLNFSPSGQTFIMDRSGDLVATSTLEIPYIKQENGQPIRLPAIQSQDGHTKAIATELRQKYGDLNKIQTSLHFKVPFKETILFARVVPYRDRYGIDWLLVTVIPESDFMSKIQATKNQTILLCGLTLLLATGIGFLTARSILNPILRLSQAAQDMARGKWQEVLSESSNIAEIRTLSESFNLMSVQLHQSLNSAAIALQETQEKYQVLFQTVPIGIAITDLTGQIIDANPASDQILGITTQEMISRTYDDTKWQILYPDGSPMPSSEFPSVRALQENRFIRDVEQLVVRPDGSMRWIRTSAIPIPLEQYGVAIVYVDITDRKQAEIALRESEAKFQRIAASSPGAIYIAVRRIDGSSDFEYMSSAGQEIFEVPVAQILENANLCFEQFHPDDMAGYLAVMEIHLETEQAFCHTWRIITPSGQIKWIQANSRLKRRDNGEIAWYGIVLDITEYKQAEIALAQALVDAEAATKAKSDFLANMSHEIRTPMNGVLGMAQLLATTNLTKEQKDFVQTIQDCGDALLIVINSILDFSKIESGKLELIEEAFVLDDLLNSVVNLLSSQACDKKLDLHYSIAPYIPVAIASDRSRLRQILVNLVGNAIKFTHEGSVSIAVSGHSLANFAPESDRYELMFAVQDSGIGIASDRIDRLFQPFTQADASISRQYGGTGLGLTISKGIVELMGGTIWVESHGYIGGNPPLDWSSDRKTQGSTFYFGITVSLLVAMGRAVEIAEKEISVDACMATKFPLKILLVEDGLLNQKLASYMLERLGYKIDVVNNGYECLDLLKTQPYELILMDMQMPEMDGLSATQKIRRELTYQPWIIALTANALPEDRRKCLAAGMNDYISKPVRLAEIVRALAQYIEIKRVESSEVEEPQKEELILPAIDMTYFRNPPEIDNQNYFSVDESYEMLGLIIDDANKAFQALQIAITQNDAAQISFHAHALKGIGLMFRAIAFAKLCVELEKTAKVGEVNLSEQWNQNFALEYERFIQAIGQEHQRHLQD